MEYQGQQLTVCLLPYRMQDIGYGPGMGTLHLAMHGIGQGNGAGPAIWAVLSTPLLNLLRTKGCGCEFISPISQMPYSSVGYAFVDDTDVIESKLDMMDHREARNKLQIAVDTWEGGLKATCGAIVPEKTFWYLTDFQWAAGMWKTLSYPLPALNLTREECDKVMRPVLQYLLPAIGVCRSFPRSLVYTSEQYMGLGVKNLHTTQEILRLKDILSHVYQRTDTGKLYRTTLELFILELGIGTDLHLLQPHVIQLLSTDSRIKSTVQFYYTME
jgi:hypothetical protein